MAAALTQISGYAHVAVTYGMEEAVFLNAIMFWYRTNRGNNRNFHDGRWWTYNSIKAFEEIFPWWNGGQIRRIIARCKDKGALLAGSYNENPLDRTAWYTPSDELLELYGESANCICRKQQMQSSETAETFDENGKCYIRNTCSNHEETNNTPYSPPEGDGAVPDSEAGTSFGSAEQLSRQPAAALGDKPKSKTKRERFVPPDVEQVRAYCRERGNNIDPEAFVDYYASKGWVVGRSPMKDWRAAVRTWEQRRNTQRREVSEEDEWFR